MRGLVLAALALVAGPPAPTPQEPAPAPRPDSKPGAEPRPCAKRRPVQPEEPSAAQRQLPGLF